MAKFAILFQNNGVDCVFFTMTFTIFQKSTLTTRVYYLRLRDFVQILGQVFGCENLKKATIPSTDPIRL